MNKLLLSLILLLPLGVFAQKLIHKVVETDPTSVQFFWNGGSSSGMAKKDFAILRSTVACGPSVLSQLEYQIFKSEFGIRIDCEISHVWSRLGFTFPVEHIDTAYWLIQEMVLRPDTLSQRFKDFGERLERDDNYHANDPDTILKTWVRAAIDFSLVSGNGSKSAYRRQRAYIESIGLKAKPNGDLPYTYSFAVNHNLLISATSPLPKGDSLFSSLFESLWPDGRLRYHPNPIVAHEAWAPIRTKKAESFVQKGVWAIKKPSDPQDRVALEFGLMIFFDSLESLNFQKQNGATQFYDAQTLHSREYASISFQSKEWKKTIAELNSLIENVGGSITSEKLKYCQTLWLNDFYSDRESNRDKAIVEGIKQVEARTREYGIHPHQARKVSIKDIQEQVSNLDVAFFIWGTD